MSGELEGQVLSQDVEGVKEFLRRREEQGSEPPRNGLASSCRDEDTGSIHKDIVATKNNPYPQTIS